LRVRDWEKRLCLKWGRLGEREASVVDIGDFGKFGVEALDSKG
jgi:hypothetical protein